jgi:rod shape-determining protein MreC
MSSKVSKILLIILLIAILVFLNKFAIKEIKDTFYLVSYPLSKVFWKAGEELSDFFAGIFRAKSLTKENQQLIRQNLFLLKEITTLKHLKKENETLREALNLGPREKFELALTEVIAKEPGRDFILITGGKAEGISEDMPVITKEGVLVGKTKEVFENFSKVMLISAKESAFDVEIGKEERFLALAKGKGQKRLEFQLVPQKNQIKKGDIVQTTTFGGNFPKGLLVGEVSEVRKSDLGTFQEGEIRPYFAQTQLKTLFVIKNFKVPK